MIYDRHDEILSLLKKNGSVKVSELTGAFHVSIETIRRDLQFLENEGLLKRVYGGAVSKTRRSIEPLFADRQSKNSDEKHAIGALAATLVENGDVVGIDTGTTTMELALSLRDRDLSFIAITNSIPIAAALSESEKCEVILIGGKVRRGELSVGGDVLAGSNMRLFQTDKLFLGVGGITERFGVTDYRTEETVFRRVGVRRAREVYALADHSKFGVTAMNHVCDLQDLTAVITDARTEKSAVKALQEKNVRVMIAEDGSRAV